jgi:hypothetical protein
MNFAELSALYHQPLFDLISQAALFICSIGVVKKFSGARCSVSRRGMQ